MKVVIAHKEQGFARAAAVYVYSAIMGHKSGLKIGCLALAIKPHWYKALCQRSASAIL
jgi:hypothetical protein